VRQTDHGLTVQQVSPGVELLGKRMEYRMNGYFPVGRDESHSYGKVFGRFQGHSILIKQKKKFAMRGGDAELGVHITQSTRHDVYAGAGPYYLTADPFSSWGGKARLLWRYKEYLSLQASYSYDKLFHNVFQGTVGLSYPLGKKIKRKGQNCYPSDVLTLSRAAFAPYRFEIPIVKRQRHYTQAINPTTGQPWNVWFVNNMSHSLGTFESPFPTLTEAQNAAGPNDIIYVFSGDGTSRGMDLGILLQNGQKLLGAGMIQTIPTTIGSLSIPAFSPQAPILTNLIAPGHVVNLSNGNEVAGLDVRAAISNCILIKSPGDNINSFTPIDGINGASIHHNTLSGTVSHSAIALIGYGTFYIQNNTCLDQFSGIPFEAMRLDVFHSNALQAFVENNSFQGYRYGMGLNVSDNATGEFVVSNNTHTQTEGGFGSAIFVGGFNGPLTKTVKVTVINNQFTMLNSLGMYVSAANNMCISGQIENNTFMAGGIDNGMLIDAGTGSLTSLGIVNNQFQIIRPASFGIVAVGTASATLCLDLSNNTSNASGYQFDNSPGGTFNTALSNNIGSVVEIGTINHIAPGTCPTCQ
jgi:hypothetical protein